MSGSKRRGMIPIFECREAIPCNPCEYSCPRGAIKINGDITNLPELDAERCSGCKICAAVCPGQAIYMLDEDYSETEGRIAFPYEFLPLPVKDAQVIGVNSQGQAVCTVKIAEVEEKPVYRKTPFITIIVPKEYLGEVRFIRLPGGGF